MANILKATSKTSVRKLLKTTIQNHEDKLREDLKYLAKVSFDIPLLVHFIDNLIKLDDYIQFQNKVNNVIKERGYNVLSLKLILQTVKEWDNTKI